MFQDNALLCYSRVTQMLEIDVLFMFLDSDWNSRMSNADLTVCRKYYTHPASSFACQLPQAEGNWLSSLARGQQS